MSLLQPYLLTIKDQKVKNKLKIILFQQREHTRHKRNGVRRLRGHFRREERLRPFERLQRLQPVPGRSLLSVQQSFQEVGCRQEGGRPGGHENEVRVGHPRKRSSTQITKFLFCSVCTCVFSVAFCTE